MSWYDRSKLINFLETRIFPLFLVHTKKGVPLFCLSTLRFTNLLTVINIIIIWVLVSIDLSCFLFLNLHRFSLNTHDCTGEKKNGYTVVTISFIYSFPSFFIETMSTPDWLNFPQNLYPTSLIPT